MVEHDLHQIAEELAWHLGPDVYASIVTQDTADILQQVTQEIGLPFKLETGEPGEKYTFASGIGVHHGEFEEGQVIVKINYESNPEKMGKLWKRVDDIKREKSLGKA